VWLSTERVWYIIIICWAVLCVRSRTRFTFLMTTRALDDDCRQIKETIFIILYLIRTVRTTFRATLPFILMFSNKDDNGTMSYCRVIFESADIRNLLPNSIVWWTGFWSYSFDGQLLFLRRVWTNLQGRIIARYLKSTGNKQSAKTILIVYANWQVIINIVYFQSYADR